MKALFGTSKWTSIIGYIIAGLIVVQDMTQAGETSWFKISLAVLIAVGGRISADANQVKP